MRLRAVSETCREPGAEGRGSSTLEVEERPPEPAPEPVVAAKPEPPPLPDYVVRGALEPQRDRSTADWLEALRERARKQP